MKPVTVIGPLAIVGSSVAHLDVLAVTRLGAAHLLGLVQRVDLLQLSSDVYASAGRDLAASYFVPASRAVSRSVRKHHDSPEHSAVPSSAAISTW